ncbi:MAG: hypothetical protein WC299_06435 [Kiritimatiellia bacterium]
MSAPNFQLARLALAALPAKDRLALLREYAAGPAEIRPDRIIRREQVAGLLSVSLRCVDKIAREGTLTRVMLPGRVRAAGYRESEVRALIDNKVCEEAKHE